MKPEVGGLAGSIREEGSKGNGNQKSTESWYKKNSRVAQGAYLEVEYIRNVLSVSGTLKYADSGTA